MEENPGERFEATDWVWMGCIPVLGCRSGMFKRDFFTRSASQEGERAEASARGQNVDGIEFLFRLGA